MVQYLSIHKDVSDSACCVVRHTDAGPVRWARCEPGQVGNQAALSSQYDQASKELDRITEMKEKYDSIAENGTTRVERFDAESESRYCGFKMQPLYSKMNGIHTAKEQIYKMEDDLRKIIGGHRMV